MKILPLNPEQQKLFKKLKAAYQACVKANILFVNDYGSLEPYDKALVKNYTANSDESDGSVVSSFKAGCLESLHIANEWSDDEHFFVLTKKGFKFITTESNDDDDDNE